MNRLRKHNGYILLPVIVVITLVAAIALLMNTESALESNTAATELDAQQAQYVAEAGMNHALWQMRQQGCGAYTNLTNVALGSDKYTTALVTDLGATTSYSITVDQDSWIREDQPTTNKATDLKLHTKYEIGKIERPLLRYDLGAIPAKATILSATAWFYVTNVHPEGPVDIHALTADWLETDATWDSMNDKIDKVVLTSIPAQPGADVWVSANLTAQVQAWVNGQPNYGITLNSTSEDSHGQYNSRESANVPYLQVIVGTPPSSPATLKAVGTLANGVIRSITRDDVTLYQNPPTLLQFQPDAAGAIDSYIWKANQTTNYGNDDETWVATGSSNEALALFKFDLSDIPPGARVLGASLSLYHRDGNDADVPISAHRITSNWTEADVTWEKAVIEDWDTQGGDYDPDAVSTTLVGQTGPGAGPARYEWDVSSLVLGWLNGSFANHGVVLRTEQAGIFGERFDTSDHADPTHHPRLNISYNCACGEVCVAPQGSGNLLMVVINPTTLVAEDQQAKDLFESWGYTVSVIGESANQTSYDAAVAINDVVFISETVNSNSVGTKLVDAPIGVVSQDGDYNPDLGLATGSTLKVGTDIDITSTDHYITRVFPVGPLPIYAADMEQLVTSGALTADQQSLAEIGGDASLVVLDRGAAMEGGGNAAGRRAVLPLGTRYKFNWDYLNANGRQLVQRALKWGIGADMGSSSNLLLVVVNPGSLNAQESVKKALIESWGYTVTLIDEADSQTNFDAALAVSDVAYISGDVSDTTLGTKLTATTLGVVNEQIALHNELGFSQSAASNDFTNIFVVDNSHSITDGFATGWLTIATSDQPLNALKDTLAPGLQNLAEVWISGANYDDGLAVLETGAQLYGGGNAAGRRAQLPWGATGFDVNALNDNGKTIMQRAIEWAGGAGCPGMKPLLLVVGNDSPLVGKDDGMKTLMESWCYSVTVIDDGASQASFDVAVAAADVVYVSGTTSGPSLQDKLTGSPTPIVNEINGKLDNFGFSSSTASSVTESAFSATNASHYISDPFAGNPVTVFTTDLTMPVPGGTLAPDLQIVGETTGAIPALVTLDAGAQRWDGNPAPARRVHLPFTNAEPGQLTTDGETLMQRALEWAAGSNTGPIAHWKLDETGGFNAEDSASDNDGTLTSGNDWIPALIDGGLDFDGSNDYVDAGTFDVTGSGITMMGWFNAEAIATDDGRIVSKANGPNATDAWWQLSTTDSGSNRYLRMRIKAGGTTTTFADSSVNLTTAQWYFAVGTYDSATGDMRLYLDGAEVANGSHAVGGAIDTDAAVPVAIGANGTAERFFNGILDDVRVYNYALSASEISDLYAANAPLGPSSYTETYQSWSATSDNTWQSVDLGVFGVPADAVVEVAITNAKDKNERWGGVRAVGSSLDRRFRLHEAEGGGVDAITLHVQTDSSSRIEHYSEKKAELTFTLLGYWAGARYVELFEPFTADNNNTWVEEDLGDDGLGPNQIAEIVMLNTNQGAERLAGVRPSGASYQRRFNLHEAEAGGVDAVTMMTSTDASSIAEVFATNAADIDFYVVGFWSAPPGTYVATGGVHGQATATSTWEQADLAGFGVPADSVAQFVISSEVPNFSRELGVREVGSGELRVFDLHKAEAGGSEDASLHVNVDSAANIEWYSASGTSDRYFYPVGWWVLSP